MRTVQQIWQGDCTILGDRFKTKRNIKSLITDPPFGVNNQSNSAVTPEGKAAARKIANDESPEQAMEIFHEMWSVFQRGMRDDSDIYVFTSYQVLEEWLNFTRVLFQPQGFERKALLVWEKDGPGQGDLNTWGMGMEFCLYFKRGNWVCNDKRRNSVLHVPQIRPSDLIHPHEKPVPLLELLIQHSTVPGDLVVDPFGGSGSLARAARATGRSAVCIELDALNVRLATEKLESSSDAMF